MVNHLTPNGHYTGRTAQLTSRCLILYIYSTNISVFSSSKCRLFHNATFFGRGARGGLVVKALSYKPAGRGFDSR